MSAVTDLISRVDAEARARRVDLRRMLLTVVAALPFLIGVVSGLLARATSVLWSWAVAAVVLGFNTARGTRSD